MSRVKQTSKRKRRSKAVPVLGAAGLSLTLASGASAATGGAGRDVLTQRRRGSHEITLREEEVADVSLATFYVFDKENAGPVRPGPRLAMGACSGCGGCRLRRMRLLDRHLLHLVGVRRRWRSPPPVRHKYYAPKHAPRK